LCVDGRHRNIITLQICWNPALYCYLFQHNSNYSSSVSRRQWWGKGWNGPDMCKEWEMKIGKENTCPERGEQKEARKTENAMVELCW